MNKCEGCEFQDFDKSPDVCRVCKGDPSAAVRRLKAQEQGRLKGSSKEYKVQQGGGYVL